MAEEKSYIGNNEIVDSISGDELVPIFKGNTEGGSVYNAEQLYARASEIGGSSKTDFEPTVSDLVGGTFTVTNFLITEVGGVVEFSFAGRFDLAAATTTGGCKIDLPPAFQPASNWASQTDVVCTVSRTNGIITAETKITADDSGSKLISIQAGDTIAEASVRFSAIGRYKRS